MKVRILLFAIVGLLYSCTSEKREVIDFESIFNIKTESFTIDQQKEVVIVGKKGTRITIPSKAFSDSEVKINLKEFYTRTDFLKAGLTTSSNGKVIESKGMIFLQALDKNGNEINTTKQISIEFKGQYDERFLIFNGEKTSSYINWTQDSLALNYHIYHNHVFAGQPCINCDYASDTFRIDTVLWDKPFTQFDTIFTWSNSKDTVGWNEFWGSQNETLLKQREIKRVLNTSKLGWINCDAFLELNDLIDLKVSTNYKGNPYCFAVFKKRNSILEGRLINGDLIFNNLPKGEMVAVVVLEMKNDEMYYGELRDVLIGSNEINNLKVHKQKIEDVILKFEKINE